MRRLFALFSLGLALSGVASAQDARVQAALDELGYKYEIDSDGDYKMVFNVNEGRTQVVFVRSATETLGQLEIREVYAPAMVSKKAIKGKLAHELMLDSNSKKYGAWQLMPTSNGGELVVFMVKLDASAVAADIDHAILAVITTADERELQLTGKDDL